MPLNSNHGTAQNGVTFGTDRIGNAGKAASFNGVDDFVQATSSQILTTITTSFWFKPSNLDIQTPFCLGVDDGIGSNPALNGISLFVPSNVVKIVASDLQSISTGYSFPSASQWYFVSVQQNAGQYKMFVNSSLVFTGNGAIPRPATQIRIGSATNVRFFNGLMDDLRIYNRALTDTEVQALYQAESPPIDITTGLVAHYKMDGNAQDASGNSNHGTQQGGVNFTTVTDRFGVAGKAAGFDGVDDRVVVSHNSSIYFSNSQPYSITTWIKASSNTEAFTILKNANYGLQWRGSTNTVGFYNGTYHYSTKNSWNLNQWYQLTLIDNGVDKVSLYVNGVLDKIDTRNPSRFGTYSLDNFLN